MQLHGMEEEEGEGGVALSGEEGGEGEKQACNYSHPALCCLRLRCTLSPQPPSLGGSTALQHGLGVVGGGGGHRHTLTKRATTFHRLANLLP